MNDGIEGLLHTMAARIEALEHDAERQEQVIRYLSHQIDLLDQELDEL